MPHLKLAQGVKLNQCRKIKQLPSKLINQEQLSPKIIDCYNKVFSETPFFLRPRFEAKTRVYSNLPGYNSKNQATIYFNHIFYKSKKYIMAVMRHEKRHTWQHVLMIRRKAGIVGTDTLIKEIKENPKLTPFAKNFYRNAIKTLGPINDRMPQAKFADRLIAAERKNPTRDLNISAPPSFLKTLKVLLTTNPFAYKSNLLEKDAMKYANPKNWKD